MRTLVVAPHPDDEILGCGGTLLRRKADRREIAWLIVTGMSPNEGWSAGRVRSRDAEIDRVAAIVGFDRVYNLRLPTAKLDTVPMADIVSRFSDVFNDFKPSEVFVPHRGDAHSDHRVSFDATTACTKWFRHPFVRRVLAYETPSETGFGLDQSAGFQPNVFVDVSTFLDQKIEALKVYQSELGAFPFPRSIEAVRALAATRGASAGCAAAEAFCLLRELEVGQ
ncbi:MAG TPA: PIG-L family deacetylase [Gemmatimonadaceae bacterium]|nr:PIG-L family deacetylase [Gemmatimonadaceae bacterium]